MISILNHFKKTLSLLIIIKTILGICPYFPKEESDNIKISLLSLTEDSITDIKQLGTSCFDGPGLQEKKFIRDVFNSQKFSLLDISRLTINSTHYLVKIEHSLKVIFKDFSGNAEDENFLRNFHPITTSHRYL